MGLTSVRFTEELQDRLEEAAERLRRSKGWVISEALAEFMEKAKMCRWKFNQLRSKNKINVIQRGKKLFVPASEVRRYFEGEME